MNHDVNRAYAHMDRARLAGAYLEDMRVEMVKMLRTPGFAVPTIAFPVMFYLLFGVLLGSMRGNMQMGVYALAAYAVFGTMSPGLFGFGVTLALEREQGLLTFRQALPAPPGAFLLARMAMAMLFVSISTLLLIVVAITAGKVELTFPQALLLYVTNVLGVMPFAAIGLYLGAISSGNSAPAIINVVYLPMAFLAGLWVPLQFLPPVVQQLAPLWPAHHLAQLSLTSVGAPSVGATGTHLAALLGVTVLFFILAMRKLGNRGFSLLGPARAGAATARPLRRAFSLGVVLVSIGLIVAGALGGLAPRAAVAATSKDADDGSAPPVADSPVVAPVGVAAPEIPVIADFDAGSSVASYGIGWTATDDKMRGGNSSVSQKLVAAGARQSAGALEVSGEIGSGLQYPFAGTSFLPNGKAGAAFVDQGHMDFSARQSLSFQARGDGGNYVLLVMGPVLDAIPAMYHFAAGPEWQEIRVPLTELGGADLQRIKVISVGSMSPGPFRFQIDDVRID
jgi:ABC-2 type transport system permease protein